MTIWTNWDCPEWVLEDLSKAGIVTKVCIPDDVEDWDFVIVPVEIFNYGSDTKFIHFEYPQWSRLGKEVNFVFVPKKGHMGRIVVREYILNSPKGECIVTDRMSFDNFIENLREHQDSNPVDSEPISDPGNPFWDLYRSLMILDIKKSVSEGTVSSRSPG